MHSRFKEIAPRDLRRLSFKTQSGGKQKILYRRRRKKAVVGKMQNRAMLVEGVCEVDPRTHTCAVRNKTVSIEPQSEIRSKVRCKPHLVLKINAAFAAGLLPSKV